MASQDTKALTRCHVPQAYGSIKGTQSHSLLILSPGECRDRFFLPVERSDAVPSLDFPNSNSLFGSIASR